MVPEPAQGTGDRRFAAPLHNIDKVVAPLLHRMRLLPWLLEQNVPRPPTAGPTLIAVHETQKRLFGRHLQSD